MNHPPELIEQVVAEIRRQRGSPHKAAISLRIAPSVVFDIFDANREEIRQRVETFGGLGRPELRQQIVARTKVAEGWDNKDPSIALARADYAAGRVELVTGRDGGWLILYAQPRKHIVRGRENYWKLEVG